MNNTYIRERRRDKVNNVYNVNDGHLDFMHSGLIQAEKTIYIPYAYLLRSWQFRNSQRMNLPHLIIHNNRSRRCHLLHISVMMFTAWEKTCKEEN